MSVPRLALGTAPMMGRVSRRQSRQALVNAWAAGIRHFDTARSYGWGQAEGVLGTFLRGRKRGEFHVVTKCGIFPQKHSPLLGAARSAARAVLALAPSLRSSVRRAASAASFQPVHVADVATLKESLATSLKELGLTYVDTLLLHNFEPDRPGLDEVVSWFGELRREGLARRTGFSIEGDLKAGLDYLGGRGWLDDAVIQVPVAPLLTGLPSEWRQVPFIAHSPFSFLAQQAQSEGKLRTFADVLRALDEQCRCEALVCSMFTQSHLAANVATWHGFAVQASRASL
jgi:hypothetical protein